MSRDKAEEIERTYTYDALNRLTQVDGIGIVASASRFKNAGARLAAAALIDLAKQTRNSQARETLVRNAEKLGAVLPNRLVGVLTKTAISSAKPPASPGAARKFAP